MHDPSLINHPVFEQEANLTRSGTPEDAVAQTTQVLLSDGHGQMDERDLQKMLEHLGLRSKGFVDLSSATSVTEILRSAYDMIYGVYWLQVVREKGWRGKALKALSGFFQLGIGPPWQPDAKSLYFAVFSSPACPVYKAYGQEHSRCHSACELRSKRGVFTNALLSQALSYYHPQLKLRLHAFRSKPQLPCVYKIVLE